MLRTGSNGQGVETVGGCKWAEGEGGNLQHPEPLPVSRALGGVLGEERPGVSIGPNPGGSSLPGDPGEP